MHTDACPTRLRSLTNVAFLAAATALAAPAGLAQSTAPAPASEDEVVQLSPFEVNAGEDSGYYASQTLSGTRINSKIEDLASSITVVTKQQLVDTAAVDINDIFLYESNTEGMHQYTEFVQDRAFYNEVTTLNPQSANRIRGVGSANMARGNFAASSSIPVDTYNVDAVEISRGPNANIFGLGNASGTVNLLTMRAGLEQDISQVSIRGDSYGGWRTTLDVGRPIISDKLAVRFAAVHEEKGFQRKPSHEDIDRQTIAFTARPWRKTTLRASFENYKNDFNRGNTTLPRDSYSEWMASGMPVWNPLYDANPADTVTPTGGWRLLNETTYTPVRANTTPTTITTPDGVVTVLPETTGFPVGIYPNFNTFWARPSSYVDGGAIQRFEMARVGNANAPGFNNNLRYSETGSIYRRGGNAFGAPPLILFQMPSISDKSHYDYENINFLAPNFGNDKAKIYQVELEQTLIESGRHYLAAQVGFFREDIHRLDHAFLSRTDGATPLVSIDINEFYFDGTPNPFFLRPYIFSSEPRVKYVDELNDNYRGTLAYQLDFAKNDGWSKWLGLHRFAGYAELRDLVTTSTDAREVVVSDHPWTTANNLLSLPLRGAEYHQGMRYYVGGPVTEPGPVIDYATPSPGNIPGSLPFIWYGNGSPTPITETVDIDTVIFSGSSRKREIRTQGVTWQGFFWNDRIIPTIGWRKDRQRETQSRSLNSNPAPNATSTIDPATRLHDLSFLDEYPNPWDENEGTTRTRGVVIKPLSWLNLHYNESDSFVPAPIRWDINLNQLSNPVGDGKDYGISVELLEGKLFAKLNKYETIELNSRSGATSGAFAARTFRFFFDPNTELVFNETTQTFPNSLDPFDLEQAGAQWFLATVPGLTPVQAREMAMDAYVEPFGFDDAFMQTVRDLGGGSFAEVNTVTSKGYELEIIYNPSRDWTMKFTAAQQEAVDSELSNNINNFFDENIDAMRAIIIPDDPVIDAAGNPVLDEDGNQTFLPGAGTPWFTHAFNTSATGSAETWYFVNMQTTLKQASVNAGKPRPQTRKYRWSYTTNYKLANVTENKFLKRMSIGGAIRWEDKASVGFFGAAPLPNGAIVDLDPNRPIYDKARTSVDFLATYTTPVFGDKASMRLQLNVRNAFESGRLQPFVYNPDGQPWNYRIIDPRQFILTATFDL